MVIAGSVNNDSKPWKINGPTVRTGWGPRAERAGVSGPLAVGGRGVINIFSLNPRFVSACLLPGPILGIDQSSIGLWPLKFLNKNYIEIGSPIHKNIFLLKFLLNRLQPTKLQGLPGCY